MEVVPPRHPKMKKRLCQTVLKISKNVEAFVVTKKIFFLC